MEMSDEEKKQKAKEYQRQWYLKNKERCKEVRQSYYERNKKAINARNSRNYHANPSAQHERVRKWTERNREEWNEYQKQWAKDNPGKVRERMRRYRKRHPDRVRENARRWQRNNYDKWLVIKNSNNHKRRARERNAEGSFSVKEWLRLVSLCQNKCCSCGADGMKLTVDHITPLTLGGTNYITNIQPLCSRCNSSKGATEKDYITNFLKSLYSSDVVK